MRCELTSGWHILGGSYFDLVNSYFRRVVKLTMPSTWKSLAKGLTRLTLLNGLTRPFKTVRKREEVDMQWVRVAVAVALSMNFFDNVQVHKTVLMTEESGETYIRTKPGGLVMLPL